MRFQARISEWGPQLGGLLLPLTDAVACLDAEPAALKTSFTLRQAQIAGTDGVLCDAHGHVEQRKIAPVVSHFERATRGDWNQDIVSAKVDAFWRQCAPCSKGARDLRRRA